METIFIIKPPPPIPHSRAPPSSDLNQPPQPSSIAPYSKTEPLTIVATTPCSPPPKPHPATPSTDALPQTTTTTPKLTPILCPSSTGSNP
ncbi:hypothetical protein V6N13_124743 [Hibiscus sabdariffa]|uniref:Uncharacterized protein n=1 Tax=Hibiscus sabdariffa TaxID=183260 RepID=A0ABR2U4L2_9ROSI